MSSQPKCQSELIYVFFWTMLKDLKGVWAELLEVKCLLIAGFCHNIGVRIRLTEVSAECRVIFIFKCGKKI